MVCGRGDGPVHLPLLQAERCDLLARLNVSGGGRLNLGEHLRGSGGKLRLAGHDGGNVLVNSLVIVDLDHRDSVPSVSHRTDQWRVIGEAS